MANSSFCAIQFPVETDKSDVHSVKNNILNERKRKKSDVHSVESAEKAAEIFS